MTQKAGKQTAPRRITQRCALLLALITMLLTAGCPFEGLYGELDWGTLPANLQVVYDLNGGDGEPPVDAERYSRNSAVTTQPAPAIVTPPTGTTFYGWSTSPDGYGNFHAAETAFTITRNTTLYALWNGDGTSPDHPKLGTTKEELKAIGENDNFALVSDVDDINETILPSQSFKGSFDGRGHTVTLNIDETGSVTPRQIGLFYSINTGSVIKNLHVAGSITINDNNNGLNLYIGGIIGAMSQPDVTFKNCVSSVNITVTSPSGTFHVGGLIGYAPRGISVEHCYASGTISVFVTKTQPVLNNGVGGIAGAIGMSSLTVTGSFSNTVSLTSIAGSIHNAPYEATRNGFRRIQGFIIPAVTNQVSFTNNYALGTVMLTDSVGPVTQTPNADLDGTTITTTEADSESWWRNTAGWESVWGGANPTADKPWVWDAADKRPKLHKFD